ncbi:MAG: hypothetical protein U0350_49100 [Caldilineaceae bacterium]
MQTTITHMPLTEFEQDPVEVFRRVTHEQVTVVVEDENGQQMILRPLINGKATQAKRKKITVDYAALTAAAGSWDDVDTDTFLKQVYESRRIATRPFVDL